MVMRMRSAAALRAARTTSTVTASSGRLPISGPLGDVDDETGVGLDAEGVARLEHGGGAGLLDGGGTREGVAGPEPLPRDHAILEDVAGQGGVDLARLEGGPPPARLLQRGQPGPLEGIDYREPEIQELHLHLRRGIAVGALMGGIEAGPERGPVGERLHLHGDGVLLA